MGLLGITPRVLKGQAFDSSTVTLILSNHGNNQVMTGTVTPSSSEPHSFSFTFPTVGEGDYSIFAHQTNGRAFESDQITIDRTINFDLFRVNNAIEMTSEYNYSSNNNPLDPFSSNIPHIVGPGHTLTYVFKINELLADQTLSVQCGLSQFFLIVLNRDEADKSIYRGDIVIPTNIEFYYNTIIFRGTVVDLAGNSQSNLNRSYSIGVLGNPINFFSYIDTSRPSSSFFLYADNPTNGSTAESDFTTTDSTPTIGGGTDAGAAVYISVTSNSDHRSIIVKDISLPLNLSDFRSSSPWFEKNTFWSYQLPMISAGSYLVTVTVTDRGGNVSSSSNAIVVE